MRGYGRDYEHRGWLDRAGETVRGWFGGGHGYDRDYGGPGNLRDWQHGTGWSGGTMDRHSMGGGMMNRGNMDRGMMGGPRTNNWNNMTGYDATFRAGSGYYGADYGNAGTWGANRGYDRDMGSNWQRGRTMHGGMGGMNRGGMDRGGMDRGGMDRGGMDRGMNREWLGNEYGGGGYNAGNDWGDYNQGGWGGDLFRRSNAGGVEPGRHFRGYGHGSTGGNGYEPF